MDEFFEGTRGVCIGIVGQNKVEPHIYTTVHIHRSNQKYVLCLKPTLGGRKRFVFIVFPFEGRKDKGQPLLQYGQRMLSVRSKRIIHIGGNKSKSRDWVGWKTRNGRGVCES